LVSIVTNDARCAREIKPRIIMIKGALNKKKTLFTSKLDLNCKEETGEVLQMNHSIVLR
jgi:hypothetical protein